MYCNIITRLCWVFKILAIRNKINLKCRVKLPQIVFILIFFIFQDFELWDDVGLNIPKPPDLLQLYRDFGNHQVTGKDLVDVASGVEESELEALTPVSGNLPPTLEIPQTLEVSNIN